MTASLRASATFALVAPLRLAKRMPHAFNVDHVDTRVSSTLAASSAEELRERWSLRPEELSLPRLTSRLQLWRA